MSRVMLDLETLGTMPGCVILSIGAVIFDPATPAETWPTFYAKIDADTAEACGLTVCEDTLRWWGEQSPEARDEAFSGTESLLDSLIDFAAFYKGNDGSQMWSHGGDFDGPVLKAAFHAVGLDYPASYKAGRCTRTLYEAAGVDPKAPEFQVGTLHNALDDAMAQALAAAEAMRRLPAVANA